MELLVTDGNKVDKDSIRILRNLRQCNLISKKEQVNNFCEWLGVDCYNGSVCGLHWNYENDEYVCLQHISLDWLPRGIVAASMSYQFGLSGTLQTNLLPASLKLIEATQCRLNGSLDLTRLPAHLKRFLVPSNLFSGTIRITCLPKSIEEIDVMYNRFTMVVVHNQSLPENLSGVLCQFQIPHKNVEYVCLDDDSVDNRIMAF